MKILAALLTDGYKLGHGNMQVAGTTEVYSNLTTRSDKIYLRNATKFYDGKLVFVGAQGAVREIYEAFEEFFNTSRASVMKEVEQIVSAYTTYPSSAIEQIKSLHEFGKLPLEIKALPEGTKVGFGVPVMTIRNTNKDFFWLVNYLESLLSSLVWKPATNATIAAEYRAICEHYATITGSPAESVDFQCHDFSMRGMSGFEDVARSGVGHLASFLGTDSLPAICYARNYYNETGFIGAGVPATEHAVATGNILFLESSGMSRIDSEKEFLRDLIVNKYPKGIVSYVSDSFDYWAVLTEILPNLKDEIMSREGDGVTPGKLVVRPDSGDPVAVICGYDKTGFGEYAYREHNGKFFKYSLYDDMSYLGDELSEAEVKGSIEVLWETFGGTVNEKGYKVLDEHIGLIYGDSITTKRAAEILDRLEKKGFASCNVVFGVGSYTYQCNTRDTFGFAVKATHNTINGQGLDIFKDPKTDSKKRSAKGFLRVDNVDGEYKLTDQVSEDEEAGGELRTIFYSGVFQNQTTLSKIRERLKDQ